MATSKKAANYTADQVKAIATAYTAARKEGKDNATILAQIAKDSKRTVPSIRAKLSAEKVYVKETKTATASVRVKKADTIAAIAKVVPMSEAEMEGLEKATAAPLQKILDRLTNS